MRAIVLIVGLAVNSTTEHNLFYYPYASFTNGQFPLLKVAAIRFRHGDMLSVVATPTDVNP